MVVKVVGGVIHQRRRPTDKKEAEGEKSGTASSVLLPHPPVRTLSGVLVVPAAPPNICSTFVCTTHSFRGGASQKCLF